MWIYNLKNMGARQEVAFMRNNEIFKRLEKVTSVASLTPEERRSYEADVKNTRDTLNQIRTARERGEIIGKKRGEKIGERNATLRMAREMLERGFDVETVASITRLPVSEVQRL